MNRPSWNEYFMQIANLVSSRSTCESRRVGAIIVQNNRVISTGYNGPASGVAHCGDVGGCLRRARKDYKSGAFLEICPASHAEQNAISFAARHGVSTAGATIYVNTFPCKDCMNSIANAGIVKVVYEGDYNADLTKSIAKQAGIEIVKYEKELVK